MTVEIRLADSDEDLKAAFALRHRVFVGQSIVGEPSSDGRLVDVFDALSSSYVFVAVDDGEVVGTVRTTMHESDEHPCDSWFDWRHIVSSDRTSSGSMLCTSPEARTFGLSFRLIAAAMEHGWALGTRHGVAAVRPQAERLLGRWAWRRIGDEFVHPIEQAPVVPMAVDLAEQRILDQQRRHALPLI